MRHTTLTRLLGGGVVVTVLVIAGTNGVGAQSGGSESTDTTSSSTTTAAPTTTAPTVTTSPPTSSPQAPKTASPESPDGVAATLPAAKQWCDAQISGRLDTTARLRKRATDKNVTDEQRNAILAILDRTDAGLNALKPQIDAAPDGATLRPECKSIADDYRVYRLVVPQVRLTLAAAGEAAAADKLLSLADKLEKATPAHATKGKASVDVNGLLQDLRSKANDVKNQTGGIPATALAVTIDQANAGSGKPVLSQAKQQVDSLDHLLDAAAKDARTILSAVGR